MVEKALLVGAYVDRGEAQYTDSLLDELEELVDTLGIPVMARRLVHARELNAKFLIGKGKVEELNTLAKTEGLDCIIFDNELSPAQQRNWETETGVCVIDRQEVILDIFAQRARSKEARLQIDLARMIYALPRLTRAWSHLGQQGGGIGSRGEGETQLEIDRRIVRRQIEQLKAELAVIRRQRETRRLQRVRVPVPHAAIVGYTNAGKSSLLKYLSGADVLVEDKLFATLDTTTRKIELPNKQRLLLTDTVGFVRKLPHLLVESFKATLEEALTAHFLIHVVDAAARDVFEIHQTTLDVLKELKADGKEIITVLNKVDLLNDTAQIHALRLHFPEACFISVQTGKGIPEFLERLAEILSRTSCVMDLLIPHAQSALVARLHREANVISSEYVETGISLVAAVPYRIRNVYDAYVVQTDGDIPSEAEEEVLP